MGTSDGTSARLREELRALRARAAEIEAKLAGEARPFAEIYAREPPHAGETRADAALRRANRALRVLAAVNEGVENAEDEQRLLDLACEIAVDVGGYVWAWIGKAEHDERKTVCPIARAGRGAEDLDTLDVVWSDTPHGSGPTGVAIRTRAPSMITMPRDAWQKLPWVATLARHGIVAGASVPVVVDGEVFGALTLCADDPNAFDEEELALFGELARSIGRAYAARIARAERRLAEDALQRSERRFRRMIDSGSDVILLRDARGRYQYISGACERVYGFTPDELVAAGGTEARLHPDDREVPMKALRDVLAERGASRTCETRILHKNGHYVWVELAGINLVDDPDIGAVLLSARDITQRKLSELALSESELRFRQLAENIHEVFWIADSTMRRILYASPAYATIWGRSPERLLTEAQNDWIDAIHPDDMIRVRAAIARLVAGESAEVEYRITRPDGSIREVRDQGFPLRDAEGNVMRVVGIACDVTVERAAERALRASQDAVTRSEERLRRMFDGGWDIITLLSDASPTESRLVFASGSVERILGYTVAELLALRPGAIVHPDDRRILRDQLTSIAGKLGAVTHFEVRHRHKNGHYVWLETALVNLADDPAVGGILGNSRDITAHKHAAEVLARINSQLEDRVAARTAELADLYAEARRGRDELRVANAALARASRAKDEFLATMSHELRTPLNGVLGLAEALQEGVYGDVPERQQAALRRIEESGRHLLSLISDILDMAKIDAGQMDLDVRDVDVDDICRASLRMIQETARRKRLAVSLRVDAAVDGASVHLEADERRLKQILVNLLGNAVKFTPDGGSIGLDVAAHADGLRFCVWDTGIGIGADDLPRLFQPFVQIDSSLSKQHGGSGLGLAFVRKLVELHGGTVGVESDLARGSRFTVTLPQRARKWKRPSSGPTKPPEPRVTAPPSRPASILVAEDDPTNVVTVTDFLRSRGYELHVAHDGHEAVELAGRVRPDVILMDVQMPKMDGLTAMQRIRADAPPELRRVRIIALTALAMSGDRERCLAAGADEHLTKPVVLKHLAALIEAQLARR